MKLFNTHLKRNNQTFSSLSPVDASIELEYSLQRQKEKFLYIISSFLNQKFYVIEKIVLNEYWGYFNNDSIAEIFFHFAINSFLYYIGYREEEALVKVNLREKAKELIEKSKNSNSSFYENLPTEDLKKEYLFYFYKNLEIIQRTEEYPVSNLSDILQDFFVYSVLLASSQSTTDLKKVLLNGDDNSFYQVYLLQENKKQQLFFDFIYYFGSHEMRFNKTELFDSLTNTLQLFFKTEKLTKAHEQANAYASLFSEEVLSTTYSKQLQEFLEDSFSPFNASKGSVFQISNYNILEYRYLLNFVDKELSKMTLDSALFNILMKVIAVLSLKSYLHSENRNIEDTKELFDYLEAHSFNFLIGSPDLVKPHNYRDQTQIERFNNNFNHLYILGYFRKILAVNRDLLSISVSNIKIKFSPPLVNEVLDEFIVEGEFYKKKNDSIKYSKDELFEYIKNTYRNVKIYADINIRVNEDILGLLITPTDLK